MDALTDIQPVVPNGKFEFDVTDYIFANGTYTIGMQGDSSLNAMDL